MNRHDRKLWASARTLAAIGDLTVAWLNGKIKQTPGHCGPPRAETIPHIEVLAAANRAGFVTDNSQAADWVTGYVPDHVLPRLCDMIGGAGLVVMTQCRGRSHYGHGRFTCPHSDADGFYAQRCPAPPAEVEAQPIPTQAQAVGVAASRAAGA